MTTGTITERKVIRQVVHSRTTVTALVSMTTGTIKRDGDASMTGCAVVTGKVRVQVMHLRAAVARFILVAGHTIEARRFDPLMAASTASRHKLRL